MKRLLAGALAVGVVGCTGGFGLGAAAAEPAYPKNDSSGTTPSPVGDASPARIVYALGGARPPGIPWYDYTTRAGAKYFPKAKRDIVDYPAGAPFSWVPSMFATGPRDNVSIGTAISDATTNLTTAIRKDTEPAAVVGLSQGTLALDKEQVKLANDPKAPPPDKLSFTMIGDPSGRHAFGGSVLAHYFPPGSVVPVADYTMPPIVDSQYDTNRVVATYDGLADFPDRPDNLLALANAVAGASIVHTPAAFTAPSDVPPQNIRTVVNSKGAKETTYLIPVNHLPLTLPLRYVGFSPGFVDQIDSVLQPQIDAAYSRYDNPLNRPTAVDPVKGMDPIGSLDPATRDSITDELNTVRSFMPPLP